MGTSIKNLDGYSNLQCSKSWQLCRTVLENRIICVENPYRRFVSFSGHKMESNNGLTCGLMVPVNIFSMFLSGQKMAISLKKVNKLLEIMEHRDIFEVNGNSKTMRRCSGSDFGEQSLDIMRSEGNWLCLKSTDRNSRRFT